VFCQIRPITCFSTVRVEAIGHSDFLRTPGVRARSPNRTPTLGAQTGVRQCCRNVPDQANAVRAARFHGHSRCDPPQALPCHRCARPVFPDGKSLPLSTSFPRTARRSR
jgi:hypothetical protein